MSDIPINFLYQLGLVHDHADQPEGLMNNSRMWTSNVEGSQALLNRLHDASHILYDHLIRSDRVQQHIDRKISVLGAGKVRGFIKPFHPNRKYQNVNTIVSLLCNLSELASYPTTKLKRGFRNNTYQSVPLHNRVPNRDGLSSIIYALSVLDSGWLHIVAGRYNAETHKGLVTRVQPLTPFLDFLTQNSLVPSRLKRTPEKACLAAPIIRMQPKNRESKAEALLRPLLASETILPLLNIKLAKQNIQPHISQVSR